jgi:hypothetical protein
MAMGERSKGSFSERALEKQRQRDRDARDLASGAKSPAQLKRENEVFAPMARAARPNLAAARSLG